MRRETPLSRDEASLHTSSNLTIDHTVTAASYPSDVRSEADAILEDELEDQSPLTEKVIVPCGPLVVSLMMTCGKTQRLVHSYQVMKSKQYLLFYEGFGLSFRL